tara:strand:- start:336 stop:467 length:132 start_codon:yes stop_codon:yes gene_type:complete
MFEKFPRCARQFIKNFLTVTKTIDIFLESHISLLKIDHWSIFT